MRLKTLSGQLKLKNYSKYRVNWDKQERSKFQTEVKLFLKPYLIHHIVYSEFPVLGTKMTLDLFDATSRVGYEIQGSQHESYNKFFHNSSRLNYLGQIKRDFKKQEFCTINNIILVEIFPKDLPLTKEWFLDNYGISL